MQDEKIGVPDFRRIDPSLVDQELLGVAEGRQI